MESDQRDKVIDGLLTAKTRWEAEQAQLEAHRFLKDYPTDSDVLIALQKLENNRYKIVFRENRGLILVYTLCAIAVVSCPVALMLGMAWVMSR